MASLDKWVARWGAWPVIKKSLAGCYNLPATGLAWTGLAWTEVV